ncbi:CAAX amino terminal protease [Penicillium bovifimosum]|uniref:intramembrane prenyl-peptidase Rce1 n=1 Tax=Penicillium bovifimosum TaxID=126998 RepID=A0A9W9H7B8_9EURO|nr:CAAX amino terminal protease [Penicillium bovifimosum]KAJ5139041.1 CAAX amino terminal protease [Penicillium bovifimosum]
MAPVGIMSRLKSLYSKQDEPALSERTVAILSVLLTLLYVVPFYLSPTTRPSPSLSRDAPSVIRARIRAVTGSCIASCIIVLYLIVQEGGSSLGAGARQLGWWPVGLLETMRGLLLTAILFTGPLFERGIVEGEWKFWFRRSKLSESLGGWIGWRNYVAGPFTEEVLFRSAIVPLHLLAHTSPSRIVFIAPLYFGIAHVHHFYEFRLTHPDTPAFAALLRSLFQFGYTTVFGWYATFVFLRTGSLLAVVLIHSFCNWCGLPRFWGRVEAGEPIGPPVTRSKEDSDAGVEVAGGTLGIGWTVAYYLLLVAGAVGFARGLWPLTESYHALVSFTGKAA